MSKARELAELGAVYDSGALSNRNIVINGEMTVAQRGTSFSPGTSTITTLDRFKSGVGSSFNFDTTLTQSTDAPTGFNNSLKVTPDSTQTPTGSQNGAIRYDIEAQDMQRFGYGSSDAKKITVSFYVKSNKTGTYTFQLLGYDGQGTCLIGYTIDSANTWERKSITFDPDTTNAFDNNVSLGVIMAWNLAGGPDDVLAPNTNWASSSTGFRIVSGQVNFMDSTANEWYLTGVQMEVGTEATPFEHRSFGQELALCQRYYFVNDPDAVVTYMASGAYTSHATTAIHVVNFPATMRAAPTVGSYTLSQVGSVTTAAGVGFCRFTGTASSSGSIAKITSAVSFDSEL